MPGFFKNKHKKSNTTNENQTQPPSEQDFPDSIDVRLSNNLDVIKNKTGNSFDVIIRNVSIGLQPKIQTAIVYIDGLVDSQSIKDFLIESIIKSPDLQEKLIQQDPLEIIEDEALPFGSIRNANDWEQLFSALMDGETIILVDGKTKVLVVDTRGGDRRSIEEPTSQVTVRGPRDGFTESIITNTSLVRRRIKSPNLWVEARKLGKVTNTDVAIMYINGIANEKIVEEVRRRIDQIDVDSVLESGYIEQFIEDQTFTSFPTLYHTERPDTVSGNLLEGRIAIFVDGTPFVLIAPAVFIQFFQAVEDYYARFDIATALRFLRILIFSISIIAPAAYIAATTFHQEMIPTQLLIAVAAQREAVPFPAFVEAVIMEVTFEILREAGIRMPRAVGSAISIVGALVIGQAAVQAGIVSPAMTIVVAMTAIASFATPSFAMAISARLVRFVFMIAAATFGFYGIILGIIMLTIHLSGLRSFGVPYMTPMAPFILKENADTFFRLPWWALKKRPQLISEGNMNRVGKDQKPEPPIGRGMLKSNQEKGDQDE
ncbi:spore germination protein [Fredinandcohnia sp. FSL W7-1320]|uniref:spore germination protein n=1 Tax=Fredinandcohnia sp. FSL W7-1320 TaxID=2954540 RepID=UPI0030FDA667